MKIEYKKGDLFKTDIQILAHGCNCRGSMGAGIAKEFSSRWPHMFKRYKKYCTSGIYLPGSCFSWIAPSSTNPAGGVTIYNLATQEYPGPCAKLEFIEAALKNMILSLPDEFVRVAMPQIGCGIGGLDWEDVEKVIKSVQAETEIVVYVL